MAGGFGLPVEMPLTSRIEQGFVRQLEPFPADTRRLLLLAAAEPVGDVPLLWRAAERLGIGPEAAAPAEAAGLVEIGARVRFRHPLVRSAAYRGRARIRTTRGPSGARRRDRRAAGPGSPGVAPRSRGRRARRGRSRRTGALGRPGAGTRGAVGGRSVPAAGRRADARSRHARRALARRGPGEARRRRRRVRVRPPGRRRARAGRRAPARAAGAVARADRVRQPARARRAAAAARGGQAARSPGRRDGPGDLPRGDRVGDVRRAPRHRPG